MLLVPFYSRSTSFIFFGGSVDPCVNPLELLGEFPTKMEDPPEIRHDDHEALVGVILPILFSVLATANVLTGTAWIIGRGPRIISITHPAAVAGFVAMEIALAIGLFAWFWMANRSRFDQYIVWIQIASVCLGAAGLILVMLAFFI